MDYAPAFCPHTLRACANCPATRIEAHTGLESKLPPNWCPDFCSRLGQALLAGKGPSRGQDLPERPHSASGWWELPTPRVASCPTYIEIVPLKAAAPWKTISARNIRHALSLNARSRGNALNRVARTLRLPSPCKAAARYDFGPPASSLLT